MAVAWGRTADTRGQSKGGAAVAEHGALRTFRTPHIQIGAALEANDTAITGDEHN